MEGKIQTKLNFLDHNEVKIERHMHQKPPSEIIWETQDLVKHVQTHGAKTQLAEIEICCCF